MTRREQHLAEQKATARARLEAIHDTLRRLAAQEHALERRRYQTRLVAVGKLVDAAGLLEWPDAVLEKALKQIADQGARGFGGADI
jgi:hypothetical protein